MVRAVAFRLDRLLLDTQAVETEFIKNMVLLFLRETGTSPAFVTEQLQLMNTVHTEQLFGAERWQQLALGFRDRIAFSLAGNEEFTKQLMEIADTAARARIKPTIQADMLLTAVKEQGVRSFAYGYGDIPAYRSALKEWAGSSLLTDTLLLPEPSLEPWRSFWQQHDCDTYGNRALQPMVLFTGDPFFDPPLAFRIGSPVVLVGHAAHGRELPAVAGSLELYSLVTNLSALAE